MSIDPFAPAPEQDTAEAAPEAPKAARKAATPKAAAPAADPGAGDPWSTGPAEAAAGAAGDDPFGNPAPSGNYPAFKQLVGRYLVVQPTNLELQVPGVNAADKPRDRITANVMVCNGDPIAVKLDKDGDVVAELDPPVNPGDVLEGLYISGAKVVKELTPAFKRRTAVIGRLVQLPAQKAGNNKAYSLEEVPPGHPARKAAAAMWQKHLDAQAEAGVSDPFAG